MSIKFEIQIRAERVNVICEGSYEFGDALHIIESALETAVAHKLNRILFDCKKLTGTQTMMQRYELAEQTAHIYARRSGGGCIFMAVVGNEPFLDPERFGEEVAINRAVPLKVTTDMQEALDWLQVGASNKVQK